TWQRCRTSARVVPAEASFAICITQAGSSSGTFLAAACACTHATSSRLANTHRFNMVTYSSLKKSPPFGGLTPCIRQRLTWSSILVVRRIFRFIVLAKKTAQRLTHLAAEVAGFFAGLGFQQGHARFLAELAQYLVADLVGQFGGRAFEVVQLDGIDLEVGVTVQRLRFKAGAGAVDAKMPNGDFGLRPGRISS